MPPRKTTQAPARKATPRKAAPKKVAEPAKTETLTCNGCKQDWSRPVAKGKKPLLCPDCRDNPLAVKQAAQESAEERKRRADERANNLIARMKARYAAPPRDYNLSSMLDRIESLELAVRELQA